MATRTSYAESMVERDEVLYPTTDLIDTEPLYSNFTTIQNDLRQREEQKQRHQTAYHRSHSSESEHRWIHPPLAPVLSSSSRHFYSNETLNSLTDLPIVSRRVPVNIQSKVTDGHIFNLTRIVENIGYDRQTPFMRSTSSSPNSNTKNVSALLDIVLKMGGAQGPMANVWRSNMRDDYFQQWYLEKHEQRSASTIQSSTLNHRSDVATEKARDQRSNIVIDNLVSSRVPAQPMANNNNNYYGYQVKQNYGYEDTDAISSVSSHSSSNEAELQRAFPPQQQRSSSVTSILKKPNQNSPTNRHVTIRDDRPSSQSQRSVSFRETHDDTQKILQDYQQVLREHPDVYRDPNPEIITKNNPDHLSYQQNVSVRYLVPPTPPPPGPLIIREILPPRAPSPEPLVVRYQEPAPPTPPPLILREAPPPPPPRQEATVITKVLPPEPPSPRRVIVQHNPPPPPKPQSIIIEKWLPYKPAPPREVIYERVVEEPAITEFEAASMHATRQRRHSAEFESNSSRVSIPVELQRTNSLDDFENSQLVEQTSGTYDQMAWSNQQQILAMQQRGREQVEAHRQWAASRWQQHANMMMQFPMPLATPPLVVYHQPVTMNTASFFERREVRQQQVQYNPGFVYQLY